MAQKRMFDKSVIRRDDFIEMPDSTQNLYFHLSMDADDDGFVDNWKAIMRMTGKKEDDLKLLIIKQFIIPFDSGVIVIKHWKLNNYLRKDRYTDTKYLNEKKQLNTNDNEEYILKENQLNLDYGIPMVYTDKNSIEEKRIEEKRIDPFKKPTIEEIEVYCKERKNKVSPNKFYNFYESKGWMVGKNKMKDWKACVRTWEEDKNQDNTPVWYKQDILKEEMSEEESNKLREELKEFN